MLEICSKAGAAYYAQFYARVICGSLCAMYAMLRFAIICCAMLCFICAFWQKSMNHGICAFCAKRQRWQKYESWNLRQAAKVAKKYDLRFLRQAAKVAKVCIMGFALFAPSGKSGKSMNHGICAFCAKRQKWQKSMNHGICAFCAKRQKV